MRLSINKRPLKKIVARHIPIQKPVTFEEKVNKEEVKKEAIIAEPAQEDIVVKPAKKSTRKQKANNKDNKD